jgi:hypothetical protein
MVLEGSISRLVALLVAVLLINSGPVAAARMSFDDHRRGLPDTIKTMKSGVPGQFQLADANCDPDGGISNEGYAMCEANCQTYDDTKSHGVEYGVAPMCFDSCMEDIQAECAVDEDPVGQTAPKEG